MSADGLAEKMGAGSVVMMVCLLEMMTVDYLVASMADYLGALMVALSDVN